MTTRLRAADRGTVIEADSAGLNATPGLPPTALAIATAARYGADISQARSRRFSQQDFSRYRFIIAMDLGHLDQLRFIAPLSASARCRLLLPPGNRRQVREIADPYGRNERYYRRVGALIAQGVDLLLLEFGMVPS